MNYLRPVLAVYNLFLLLYSAAIRIAALFNPKAKLWLKGREGLLQKIRNTLGKDEKRVWIHCASLGEFEQGRPVIEAIRKEYPTYKIVLTFFSPSGYEVRKNYDRADYVFYLPMDGRRNAAAFIHAVQPALAVFVKYEFWYHYMNRLKQQQVPALLISAAFRPGQVFFKGYGGLFRKLLGCFNYLLVQDAASKELLSTIGFKEQVIVAGDTRYDRVAAIAEIAKELPEIAAFKADAKLIIAGSTWPEDEQILKAYLPHLPAGWKLVLAPHEIDDAHIRQVQSLFGADAVLFSQLATTTLTGKKVLIIDNIGMLSSLYRYGEIAFIGGGFNKGGIHNILEPAVFGLPVVFGPVYEKFVEAVEMVQAGYAFPVTNVQESNEVLGRLLSDEEGRKQLSTSIRQFMSDHTGATGKIMQVAAASCNTEKHKAI